MSSNLRRFELRVYSEDRQLAGSKVIYSTARTPAGFVLAYRAHFPGHPLWDLYAEGDGQGGATIFENSGRRVATFNLLRKALCEK